MAAKGEATIAAIYRREVGSIYRYFYNKDSVDDIMEMNIAIVFYYNGQHNGLACLSCGELAMHQLVST